MADTSYDPLTIALQEKEKRHTENVSKHEKLRASPEYQKSFKLLQHTVHDLIHTVRACELAASRWSEFTNNYLLPMHLEDIVEAALTARFAIENGTLNPARRELRYMLEVAVNISYVDEAKSKANFEERIKFYRGKGVKKSNVDHIKELPLRMLGEHKESFIRNVIEAWVRGSNYVHLTKRRIDDKLRLRAEGITPGFETVEMLDEIVAEVHQVCSIVMVLTFETIGPSFTGDMLVEFLDERDDWSFHASPYIAYIDSRFDYKHERKENLETIIAKRKARVKYEMEKA